MKLKEGYWFLESEKVKVFPCAYRGNNGSTTFNAEARLNSEYNYINSHSTAGLRDTNSYIVSWNYNDTNPILKCVVGGYYFELKDIKPENFKSDSDIMSLCIKKNSLNITDTETTIILDSLIDTLSSSKIDATNLNLDTIIEGTYCFVGIGLKVKGSATNEIYFDPVIKDASGNPAVNQAAFLPTIKSGSEIDEVNIFGKFDLKNGTASKFTIDKDGNTDIKGTTNIEGKTTINNELEINGNSLSMNRSSGTPIGTNSVALGNNCRATGDCSVAEGYRTVASGQYSHAEGGYAVASGKWSHAEGASSTASGARSHAEGSSTHTLGFGAHAEGDGNVVSLTVSAVNNTEITYIYWGYSLKPGQIVTHKDENFVIKNNNTTTKIITLNKAPTDTSIADWYYYLGVAYGNDSHTEGYKTTASGNYSHAEGQNTIASHNSSHAGGYCTKTSADYQTVIGKYNKGKSDTLFEVGNGTSEAETNRKNAFEVYKDGSAKVGKPIDSETDLTVATKGYVDSKHLYEHNIYAEFSWSSIYTASICIRVTTNSETQLTKLSEVMSKFTDYSYIECSGHFSESNIYGKVIMLQKNPNNSASIFYFVISEYHNNLIMDSRQSKFEDSVRQIY